MIWYSWVKVVWDTLISVRQLYVRTFPLRNWWSWMSHESELRPPQVSLDFIMNIHTMTILTMPGTLPIIPGDCLDHPGDYCLSETLYCLSYWLDHSDHVVDYPGLLNIQNLLDTILTIWWLFWLSCWLFWPSWCAVSECLTCCCI